MIFIFSGICSTLTKVLSDVEILENCRVNDILISRIIYLIPFSICLKLCVSRKLPISIICFLYTLPIMIIHFLKVNCLIKGLQYVFLDMWSQFINYTVLWKNYKITNQNEISLQIQYILGKICASIIVELCPNKSLIYIFLFNIFIIALISKLHNNLEHSEDIENRDNNIQISSFNDLTFNAIIVFTGLMHTQLRLIDVEMKISLSSWESIESYGNTLGYIEIVGSLLQILFIYALSIKGSNKIHKFIFPISISCLSIIVYIKNDIFSFALRDTIVEAIQNTFYRIDIEYLYSESEYCDTYRFVPETLVPLVIKIIVSIYQVYYQTKYLIDNIIISSCSIIWIVLNFHIIIPEYERLSLDENI